MKEYELYYLNACIALYELREKMQSKYDETSDAFYLPTIVNLQKAFDFFRLDLDRIFFRLDLDRIFSEV